MKIESGMIFDALLMFHIDESFSLVIKPFDKNRHHCEASSPL